MTAIDVPPPIRPADDRRRSRRHFLRVAAVASAATAVAAAAASAEPSSNVPPATRPSSDPQRPPRRGPHGEGRGHNGFRRRPPPQPPDPTRQEPSDGGLLEYAKLRTYRWRVTFTFRSPPEDIHNVTGYFAVPIEWPEQAAKFVEETKPAKVRTRSREVPGIGSLHIASTSAIAGGGSVSIARYYELARYAIRFVPKSETDALRVPAALPQAVKAHLGVAPGIETTLPKIVALGKTLRDADGRPWVTAKNCFDWVRKNVRYEAGAYRGARRALAGGVGDCEDLAALFIALCRGQGIPARSVWVEGHVYPEFYLEDPKASAACWIPCQLVGIPSFGRVDDERVILQKGDRVEDPLRGGTIRYLPHSARATGGQVTIECKREELDAGGKPVPAMQSRGARILEHGATEVSLPR